jgi:aryl-alcohol dehydrogenase-like predicted oxidoreductase
VDSIRLGRTGLFVSRLCLGTGTFGLHSDEKTATSILDKAAESGITFLDTADRYPIGGDPSTAGITESILGRWLNGRRDDFVLATKVHGPTGPNPWDRGLSRKHILSAVDASLRRLGTDYIDLYQLHGTDPHTPIEETLGSLDDLVHRGKVRYVGCSNFLAYQLALALGASDMCRLVKFVSIQSRYNLLFRENERELLPLCREQGIAMNPYNPSAGGMLSGEYQPGEPAKGTRFTLGRSAGLYQNRYWNDTVFETIDKLRSISAEAQMSMVELAVSWVTANAGVGSPIVGADCPEHLDDAIRAVERPMPPDLKTTLDELTADFRKGDDLF